MGDSGGSWFGSIFRAIYALCSFLCRTTLRFGLTTALIASVVLTIHAAGKLSRQALEEQKEVLGLVYWRDPKKSGVVLALTLLTLLIFAKFSLLAVLSYLGLAILGGTLGFRIYKLIEAHIKKSDSSNPFQPYLNTDIHFPQDKVHRQVDTLIEHAQIICNELKRLFLIESIQDSVKFGLLLWALTYVSSWFSGLCLLILLVLSVFTIPKVYEVYQEPIDKNISIAKVHVDNVTKKIGEKVPPFLKKPVVDADSHEKST